MTNGEQWVGAAVILLVASCTSNAREPIAARPSEATTPRSVAALAANSSSAPEPIAIAPPAIEAPARPTDRFTLEDDQARPIEVYPPFANEGTAPFVVVLHATCMQPSSVCDWFGNAGRDVGWLVCPSGNSTCAGEPDWNGPPKEKAAFLQRAIDEVDEALPTFVDARPGVLIGWSRGAFAARDILYESLTDPAVASLSRRFRGLVLLAAHVTPDVEKLRAAGITRVVMGAGLYDGSKPTMTAAVESLRAAGMEARFVSLGNIAHVWPPDFEARMAEPIAWAAGLDGQRAPP